ncbi:hypothetical protein ACQY0O_003360 [Thecaphora frezii]
MQNEMLDALNLPHLEEYHQNDPLGQQQPIYYDDASLDQFFDADHALLPEYAATQSLPHQRQLHPQSASAMTLPGQPPLHLNQSAPPHLDQLPAHAAIQSTNWPEVSLDASFTFSHPGMRSLSPLSKVSVKDEPVFPHREVTGSNGDGIDTSRDREDPGRMAASTSDTTSASQQGPAPRRRTRRRQNISCDQCRASKRGCDFQLKLDADGNIIAEADAPTGSKRKAEAAILNGKGSLTPVCSNCQRRGIECTTHFADSVRFSKQQAMANKECENTHGAPHLPSRKRFAFAGDSPLAARSASISSEAGSTVFESFWSNNNTSPLSLSWSDVNGRFADRADSLSLTTDRMRLYVSTVEPNANLWLSKACSPLRTEGDLGTFIRGAVATHALDQSQKLWASWHVDSPSPAKDHQPNLFFLVFGLDHLGVEMNVWTQKVAAVPCGVGKTITAAEAQSAEQALSAATREFYERMSNLTGYEFGKKSYRDTSIDEAVKAAMLAYACQYRLDGSNFPGISALTSADEARAIEAHDRVATAAWKKARSLLLQLAPRRSCRIAFGLFLFAVTAPPKGALAEGGATAETDAAEDAAFAFETASKHLEWYIKATRDLLRSVEEASRNPVLLNNPQVIRQKQMATDLMGLAESLGWFGLLIDTVSSVSLRRKAMIREDTILDKPSGLDTSLFGGFGTGSSPDSISRTGSSPNSTTAALFAIQETLDLLPGRQAPPGAFPGTTSSYMHDFSPDDDSQLLVDTEMSRRIMERAACARDLIPALLKNPGAISKSIPFEILLGGDASSGDKNGSSSLLSFGGNGLSEQIVLLGIAWGTAVEVYIWRRINALQTSSVSLLSATSPVNAYISGGGTFVDEKKEKLVENVLESIRLFHSIFDGLITKALDDYFSLTRQARSMLAMFVLHIHLGVLHFIRLAKDLEQKEVDLVEQFNSLSLGNSVDRLRSAGLAPSAAPSSSLSAAFGTDSFKGSPETVPNPNSEPSTTFPPLKSKMMTTSQTRRVVGKQAAVGLARITRLMTLESTHLEQSLANSNGFDQESPALADSIGSSSPVEASATAPWRHPYPLLLADALRLAAQQLHDEIWDQLLAVPRDLAETTATLGHLDTCLDGLTRLLHSVPALNGHRQSLEELRSARDTAAFVATQQ